MDHRYVKCKTIKLLKENEGEGFHDLEFGKSTTRKRKYWQIELQQNLKFLLCKNKQKFISNKGLVFRIYKELKVNSKKEDNTKKKKMPKGFNEAFHHRSYMSGQ